MKKLKIQWILAITCVLYINGSHSQASWWAKHAAQLSCEKPGYFVNPADCHRFYRCVDRSTWSSPKLDRYDFDCPNGMVFDPSVSVCSSPGPSGCAEPWWNKDNNMDDGGGGKEPPRNSPGPTPGPPEGGFWGNRPDSDEGFGGNIDGGFPDPDKSPGTFGGSGRPAKEGGTSGNDAGKPGSGEKANEPDDDGFLNLGGDSDNDKGSQGNSFGSPPKDGDGDKPNDEFLDLGADGDKPNDGFLDLGGDGDTGGNNAGVNRPPGGNSGESGMNRPGSGRGPFGGRVPGSPGGDTNRGDGPGSRGPFGGRGPGGPGNNADVDPLDFDFGSSVESPGETGSNELGNNNSDDSKSDNSDGDSQAGINNPGNDANKNDDDGNKGGDVNGGAGLNRPSENSPSEPDNRAFWVGAKPGLGEMSVPNRKPNTPQVICRPGSCPSTGQGLGGNSANHLGQGGRPGGGRPAPGNSNWGSNSRPGARPGQSANWGGPMRPSVPESSSTWRPTGMWGSPSTTTTESYTPDESPFDGSSNESPNAHNSGGGGAFSRPQLSPWGPPPPGPGNPDFAASAPYPYPFRPPQPRYPAYQIVAYPTWPGPYGRAPILVVYSNSKK